MISTNKTLYVSLYLSKATWSSNASCAVHPYEAAKIEQHGSYQAFQIDFDHDTKKLQP
jgi:hypothetical protein